jgi:DNA mismatch repair protein MutS
MEKAHDNTQNDSKKNIPENVQNDSGALIAPTALITTNVPVASTKMTPLMQQYWDIKSAHTDKILMFRMGDFFEMFHRDAEIAAPVLGIALTSRNKKALDETMMCGVPHHSVSGCINKLLQNGFKVAICDQIEDPKFAKGLVKRAVTRILSPGIVYDPDTLDALRANYIASYDSRSVSFLDTSTGEAFFYLIKDAIRRSRMLESLGPVEVVVSDQFKAATELLLSPGFKPILTVHEATYEGVEGVLEGKTHGNIQENAQENAHGNAHGNARSNKFAAWPESACRLISYARHMQGESILDSIMPFERRELLDRLDVSPIVLRHLEVFESYRGETRSSLFHAINRTKTSSGSRLLRQWLQFPLAVPQALEDRLDKVEKWIGEGSGLRDLRSVLAGLGDIQRRFGKIGNPSCNPRDLQALSESLKAGLEVSRMAHHIAWGPELLLLAEQVALKIDQFIVDEPPVQIKNGGIIRRGVDARLDELIDLSVNSNQLIMNLEIRERELTGIPSLKVRFNNVFGYYIEITHTHKDKVPVDRYDRKQTLANAERYLTPELAEIESKVLSAQAKRLELEVALFNELIASTLKESQRLLRLAALWAEVDVVSSLAWLALEQNYTRPRFSKDGSLSLRASRHPVVEQALNLPFVANDIVLPKGGCLLLTGPNMAGKSTLMRQVAITAIMAQMGSFVPAASAELPLFDHIFTRIGASDFLAEGLSTFMVEMKETAEMLQNATENSLVILDEVGRGTSTYDGMCLAQAILEYLVSSRFSLTLFATHYHELTRLGSMYPALHNAHMVIHESGGEIVFMHQLADGPANKSYGIHVARLAGLPGSVTRRASSLLKGLEGDNLRGDHRQMSLLGLMNNEEQEDSIRSEAVAVEVIEELDQIVKSSVDPGIQDALDEVKKLDVTHLTPLDALNFLAKLQSQIHKIGSKTV